MTAKEFYELNKGKYFMYGNEKIRVVGYDNDDVIISGKIGGWEFRLTHNVDRLLLSDGEKGWYVRIKDLMPIEPKEIDICEVLKGCEGMELWSDIFGKCKLESLNGDDDYEIVVLVLDTNSGDNGYEQFTKYGRFYDCYQNCKCMLWPSETNRDWSTFKKPVKVLDDDWVACFESIESGFVVCRYGKLITDWKYIIPYDKFNLNLQEEELKKLSIV